MGTLGAKHNLIVAKPICGVVQMCQKWFASFVLQGWVMFMYIHMFLLHMFWLPRPRWGLLLVMVPLWYTPLYPCLWVWMEAFVFIDVLCYNFCTWLINSDYWCFSNYWTPLFFMRACINLLLTGFAIVTVLTISDFISFCHIPFFVLEVSFWWCFLTWKRDRPTTTKNLGEKSAKCLFSEREGVVN